MKLVKFFSFFGLLIFPFILLIFASIEWYSRSIGVFVAILLLVIILFYFLIKQYQTNVNSKPWVLNKDDWIDFLFAYFASIITYNLAMFDQISTVFASALIGLIGASIFKKRETAIFCGSFLGMCDPKVFGAWGFILAGLLMSFIFVFTKPLFKGVGGKLGTIAFSGAIIAYLLQKLTPLPAVSFTQIEGLYLVLASIAGAVLTRLISSMIGVSVVQASSVTGLVFVILFDYDIFSISPYIAIAGFGASFVGMSSKDNLSKWWMVGIGGMLFGIIYYLTEDVFMGFGGKLGTIALISSLLTIEMMTLISKTIHNQKDKKEVA